jgi:hypothetical protein
VPPLWVWGRGSVKTLLAPVMHIFVFFIVLMCCPVSLVEGLECVVRPQLPKPNLMNNTVMTLWASMASQPKSVSALTQGWDTQGCWSRRVTANDYILFNETKLYQDTYGHPRYCPERRYNLIAQPQYGGYDTSILSTTTSLGPLQTDIYTATITASINTNIQKSWYFKGFYSFGAPGRVGMRFGNPGFVSDTLHRNAMGNGQTEYIRYLSDTGQFDTGGDVCDLNSPMLPTIGSGSKYGGDVCMGYDIERSHGVWDECREGNYNFAFANFIGAARWPFSAKCDATGYNKNCDSYFGSSLDTPYERNDFATTSFAFNRVGWVDTGLIAPVETMWQHNCTTCTGKYNFHTRVQVSAFDEGPDDAWRDPANPWSFTVSMIYPTFINTSSFNASAIDSSAFFSRQCTLDATKCANLKKAMSAQYVLENNALLGYVPSNHGGVVNGRWDLLTSRGFHLHYPPENWGASFEPTKVLVSGTMHYFLSKNSKTISKIA